MAAMKVSLCVLAAILLLATVARGDDAPALDGDTAFSRALLASV